MTENQSIQIALTRAQFNEQLEFLREKIREIPSRGSILRIDEYIERRRIMPEGNPRSGPWRNDYSPYLIETMQFMSPQSPIQHDIVMKAAQGGWTAAAENIICYYMDESPADILYVSATAALLDRWVGRRLEPAIESCGLRSKIASATAGTGKNKKTGDRAYSKEYSGCRLDMASARSSPSMAATDKRILIRDEIDRAPALLTTGEGSWLKVSFARTNFWSARRKVYDLSAPTLDGQSQIHELYKLGDRRIFLIPCPLCGAFQELRFGSEETQYGLKPDTEAGELRGVYYLCDHCHDAFFDEDKYKFLKLGYWEPTTKSVDRYTVSRHWSAFYMPVGALTWLEMYHRYLEAIDDPLGGMQSFVNLYLGLPFKPESIKPQIKKIIGGNYKRGTVPDDVLFLTVGVDVQAGKKRDSKKPARLELEICGHGIGYRTWSIDYKVVKGKVTDPYDGAWLKFREMFRNGEMDFYRSDGIPIKIKLVLIDTGYLPDVVSQFCASGVSRMYPTKGFKGLKQRKNEVFDEMTSSDLKRFRLMKSGDQFYYQISTVFYKQMLYDTLVIPRQQIGPQKKGFCDFPIDYPPEYFKQLTAEDMRIDEKTGSVSFWPTTTPNEAMDCRIMNLAAGHIFLNDQVNFIREEFKKRGATKDQLAKIDSLYVLRQMQDNLDNRIQEVRKEMLKKSP